MLPSTCFMHFVCVFQFAFYEYFTLFCMKSKYYPFSQDNPNFDPSRCCAFQCDLTSDDLRVTVPHDSVDVVSMIFVLSAIHPEKMESALSNIIKARTPEQRYQTEKNITRFIYMQMLLYGNLIAMANQNDFYIHSLLRCGIHNLYSRFIMYATPATRTNLFSQLCLINRYQVCQINSVLI